MSPTHTRKNGKLYRYYVTQSVLKLGPETCPVRRLPAAEVEAAVIDQLKAMLRTPELIVKTWLAARDQEPTVTEAAVRDALLQLDPLWEELFPAEQARIVQLLVARVDVQPDGLVVKLRTDGLATLVRDLDRQTGQMGGSMMDRGGIGQRIQHSGEGAVLSVHVPMTFARRGGRKRLIAPAGVTADDPRNPLRQSTPPGRPGQQSVIDEALVTSIVQAFHWQQMLVDGRFATISELASDLGLDHSLVSRTLRLTLLAPDLVEAILDGTQSAEIGRQKLLHAMPVEWRAQRV